jgi:signal transduction histidine kinase
VGTRAAEIGPPPTDTPHQTIRLLLVPDSHDTDLTTPDSRAQIATSTETWRSLPLERTLPLLIFGVLAVVLTASLGVSYYEVRRSAELSAADRLSTLSRVLSSMLQQQTAVRVAGMHRVAADSAVINALRTPDRPPSAAALKAISLLVTRADSLTPPELVTPDARAVGNVKLETPTDLQPVRAWIQSLDASADSAHVSKLYAVGGHASMWITVPVRQDGQLLGYIVQERRITISARNFQPFRDLIGSDIELYLRSADNGIWIDPSGATTRPPIESRSFQDSLTIYTHGDRGASLASTAPIRGTPLLVTLEYPLAVVLARPQALIRTFSAIAILLAVIGAGIAWFIGRRLARPLVELTGAAEAMARGKYSERVKARGHSEIGRLGTAFNRMAAQVQASSNASGDAVKRLTRSVATQKFLAEAGRILAGSLSDQTMLADLARYCVPVIADYCTIHVADDDGSIRREETAHYDPNKQAAVRALVKRYEYRIDGPGEVPETMRSRRPHVIPTLDPAGIRAAAPDEATARSIEEIGPTSFVCVPLIARGRAFGAISFTMTDSGRSFGPNDVDLAMELATRTAMAIDNALIYRASLTLRLEAEAASNAKSDFLAKMSHEIRTPINAMMGYAELLEMGIAGPVTPAQAKQLSRIRSSGDHLTALVNEILDLAKIEAGRMDVEPTIGISGDAAEAALALIRPQAATKGIELTNVPGGTPSTEYVGDPHRVQQILTNLLSNAVKFTPAGGSVFIRCGLGTKPNGPKANGTGAGSSSDEPMEWTFMTVEDTGSGVAPEDSERIFHPFVQVDNGYTRAHGGTGLGLTISRTLAQMMGGDITLESFVGEGSRFTLWLPSPNSCTTAA